MFAQLKRNPSEQSVYRNDSNETFQSYQSCSHMSPAQPFRRSGTDQPSPWYTCIDTHHRTRKSVLRTRSPSAPGKHRSAKC